MPVFLYWGCLVPLSLLSSQPYSVELCKLAAATTKILWHIIVSDFIVSTCVVSIQFDVQNCCCKLPWSFCHGRFEITLASNCD